MDKLILAERCIFAAFFQDREDLSRKDHFGDLEFYLKPRDNLIAMHLHPGAFFKTILVSIKMTGMLVLY